MNRLDGIIRLRKWELDEKRRVLAVLQGERNDIENQLLRLLQEVEEEESCSGTGIGIISMGAYFEQAYIRQKQIRQVLEQKDAEILRQEDRVSDHFKELKIFEQIRETREKLLLQEKEVSEQAELDEQGSRCGIKMVRHEK